MNHLFILFICVVLTLSACAKKDKEAAEKLLQEAKVAAENEDYNKAKLKVDSLYMLHAQEIEKIAEGQRLMQRIEINELQKSVAYYDSTLIRLQSDFDRLKKAFIFKEGKFEGYAGTYTHKRQQVKNSYHRSYIRAYLNEKGDFYISSRYHGKGHIYHHSIKVYYHDLFAETREVPKSSADNRLLDDGEGYWETVNYRKEADGGVASFIANNYDKPLKAMFKGKKNHYIILEKYDKEAVRDAYHLSLIIKEMTQFEKERTDAKKRLAALQKSVSSNVAPSEP